MMPTAYLCLLSEVFATFLSPGAARVRISLLYNDGWFSSFYDTFNCMDYLSLKWKSSTGIDWGQNW